MMDALGGQLTRQMMGRWLMHIYTAGEAGHGLALDWPKCLAVHTEMSIASFEYTEAAVTFLQRKMIVQEAMRPATE